MSNVEYTDDSFFPSVEDDKVQPPHNQNGSLIMKDPTELLKQYEGNIDKIVKFLVTKSEKEMEYHPLEIKRQDPLNLCVSPDLNDGDLNKLEKHNNKTVVRELPAE